MVEFIAGVAIGVGGMIAKDKYLGNENSAKQQNQQREIENLCNENEKYRKRNKDLERQVEDLLRENEKLNKELGLTIPKGAGSTVDEVVKELIKLKGEGILKEISKYNFKNTEKALNK